VCEGCGAEESFPSLKALRKRNPKIPASLDLHKPAVDRATVKCQACGKTARRVPEVIDCWFDSGAMPFAQWGYPHQGKREFDTHFPADFICEAIDQTRGWFYSLLAIGTLLFDRAPYTHCVVLGHVLDEKGVKMSKHLGNYLDPGTVLDTHGADALRWYFASANQPWTSVRFADKAVGEAAGEYLLTLRNVAHFFSTYARLDGFDPSRGVARVVHGDHRDWAKMRGFVPLADRPLLDRWVLSLLQGTVATVRTALDRLDTYGAARGLAELVDALSNWYVRRSRARFWGAEDTADKRAAHQTLYEALTVCARLTAPFTPFVAEDLHAALVRAPFGKRAAASVHLERYPTPDPAWRDEALEGRMAAVRQVVSIGHAARRDQKLRVRQPLRELIVIADKARADAVRDLADLVADELNVKQVTIADDVTRYAVINVRPNFRLLGPKLGPRVGEVARLLGDLPASARADAAAGRPVQVLDGTQILTLAPEELDVRLSAKEGFATGAGGGLVVALDTTVTPELRSEGLAREVISRIQGMRKDQALAYETRIATTVDGGGALGEALDTHRDLIMRETLSVELTRGECHGDELGEFTIDEFELNVGIAAVDGRPVRAARGGGKARAKKPARAARKPARRSAARK
jgi:isoleucyl-tRNA synthetase